MNQDPRELARAMRDTDPASDEALELARVALLADGARSYRVEHALAEILTVWAGRVVAHAAKGGPKLDDKIEAEAEARLWLIEQLREFRPAEEGGSVAVFLRARLSWFRSRVRRGENGQQQSHSAYTVSSAAGRAREEFLRDHRREPTGEELKNTVRAILLEQAKDKVLAGSELESEEAIETVALARMRKDGLLAAIERFDEIRIESLKPMPIRLLEAREEDPKPHWGIALPVVEDEPFDTPNREAEYDRLLSVALGDQQWARRAFSAKAGAAPAGSEGDSDNNTLRDLADEEHRSIAELKNVLVTARARVTAPHAQWAHLSPSLLIENN
jgi:hypothetical protein